MLVPTIKTAFPHSNHVCCDTIIQLCRKAVCVVCPSLYWKITIKGAWQVGPPTLALTSCIKRKIAKIPIVLTLPACQQPKIIPFGRFSWPCPCWQTSGMILHWLQNIQMWPSVPILVSHCCTSKQPQTPSSNQKSRLFPNSLCLKHTSFVFRANCFSSCKTQLNCPLLQETNYFPTGYPQHIIMVPSSTHMSLSQLHQQPMGV